MSPAVQAMNTVGLAHKVANLSISSSSLCSSYFPTSTNSKKMPNNKGQYFDNLSNDVIVKIFQWLDIYDLLTISLVCRRFSKLIWNPKLWKIITLKGDDVFGDKALNCILRRILLDNNNSDGKISSVERVMISEGCKLTEKGIQAIIKRCPNITHLQIQFCNSLTNSLLYEIVMKCTNLQHLDITGCPQVSRVSLNIGVETPRKHLLQYVDLTDCQSLDDAGLKTIMKNSPLVIYLYLRRCVLLTDSSLKILPKCCIALKELSVSDCVNITDFGLYELAKLGQTLRYLSVAKCQVSDVGLKYLARRCYKLRYVNVRGCEGISDDSIIVLARSCSRLRSLDIGKCEVGDAGCFALAESCPNLKKLSLKSCDMVTDEGIKYISYYCRGLQQLNIQDCVITAEGYNSVKKFCRRCVIQHNNISILG
jgi:F-box and leucine-rich repeat protein 7